MIKKTVMIRTTKTTHHELTLLTHHHTHFKSPPDCEDQSSGAARNAGTDICFSHCIAEPKRLIIRPIMTLLSTFWKDNEGGNETRSWATDLSWTSPSPAWLTDKKRTAGREKKRKEMKSAASKKERKMCEGFKLTAGGWTSSEKQQIDCI